MRVCMVVCVCACVCMCPCMCVCACVFVCARVRGFMHAWVDVRACVRPFALCSSSCGIHMVTSSVISTPLRTRASRNNSVTEINLARSRNVMSFSAQALIRTWLKIR